MSKAYLCDSCREFYCGYPAIENYQGKNGVDICPNCERTMKLFSNVDPMVRDKCPECGANLKL